MSGIDDIVAKHLAHELEELRDLRGVVRKQEYEIAHLRVELMAAEHRAAEQLQGLNISIREEPDLPSNVIGGVLSDPATGSDSGVLSSTAADEADRMLSEVEPMADGTLPGAGRDYSAWAHLYPPAPESTGGVSAAPGNNGDGTTARFDKWLVDGVLETDETENESG